MSDADKLAKQKAFLEPHLERVNYMLDAGIRNLRMCRIPEWESIQKDLERLKDVLEKMTSKEDIKNAIGGKKDDGEIEETGYYMMSLFNRAMLSSKMAFDEEFFIPPSAAHLRYQEKLLKSMEHQMSKKAPGFDGDGGGAARGSREK